MPHPHLLRSVSNQYLLGGILVLLSTGVATLSGQNVAVCGSAKGFTGMIDSVAHEIRFRELAPGSSVIRAKFGKFGYCVDLPPGVYSVELEGHALMQEFHRAAIRVAAASHVKPPLRLDLFPVTHAGIMTTLRGSELLPGRRFERDSLHVYEGGVTAMMQYGGDKREREAQVAYSGVLIFTADFLTVLGHSADWHSGSGDLVVRGDPARAVVGGTELKGKAIHVQLRSRKVRVEGGGAEVEF